MKVGSLFSGIGGLDLGLERAGMRIVWQVENDPFRQVVLAKHWPEVKRYGDIRTVDPAELEPVDLICGGFPCQPFSVAGKRRGTGDDRYLWPEMFRIIEALRPAWVLGENVANIVNLALDIVLSDLEGIGYETATFVIPACAVGAPHRRDRVWIVAYSAGVECKSGEAQSWQDVAHTDSNRLQRATPLGQEAGMRRRPADEGCENSEGWVAQSRLGGVFDGLSNWLDGRRWPAPLGCEQYEWDPPRLARGKIPHRRERLMALGDAVVPQVAEAIGRAIVLADAQRFSGSGPRAGG